MNSKKIVIFDSLIFDGLTKTAKIMRDGVYLYRASEVGDSTRAENDVVKVYRDKKEIEKALKRFQELGRLPLTINHPEVFVNLMDENSFKEGIANNPSISMVESYTTLDCKIDMNDAAAKLYAQGVKQLSCGWEGRFTKVEGKDYDYVQEFIDFNHIAILPNGRAGSLCAIIDNNSIIIDLMSKENLEQLADAVKDAVKEGIQEGFEIADESKEKELRKDRRKWEKAKHDKSKKERDREQAKADYEEADEEEDEYEDKKMKDKTCKTKDAAIFDEAVKVAVKDARTTLISDFAAVFEAVEKGIVSVKDCSGKEPSEIKKTVVEKLLSKKIDLKDAAILDAHYNVALENYKHPNWSAKPVQTMQDSAEALAKAIENINFLE